jgi:EmrB/QacA subfamily drug resistance transporter
LDQTVAEHLRPAVIVPHRGLVLCAALIATFMPAVESTIVATAMPTIVGDLGGFDLFSWVFAAYLLTMAVTIPVYGRLADIYGRKRLFFTGTGIFMVGTALCGLAHSMPMLIVFRAIQGFGGGAVQPISMTILGDIYTPTERARVQGYSSSVFGISPVVGPALGAFLVQHVHWSVVFWINLPIGVVSIVLFAVLLPERVERRRHQIDYAGGALLVVGVGALMAALVQAVALSAAMIGGLVVAGLAALIGLSVWEGRIAEPMLPLMLWRRRVVLLCNLGGFGAAATMMAVSALLPTYVQGVMGRAPGVVGVVVGATSVSWMFAAFAAGRLMIRTSYRMTASIGDADRDRRVDDAVLADRCRLRDRHRHGVLQHDVSRRDPGERRVSRARRRHRLADVHADHGPIGRRRGVWRAGQFRRRAAAPRLGPPGQQDARPHSSRDPRRGSARAARRRGRRRRV